MTPHPVTLSVRAAPLARLQLALRLLVLAAVAAAKWSSACAVLYVAVPIAVALRVRRAGADYPSGDASALVPVLRWIGGAYAYLWLLTDAAPSTRSSASFELSVDTGGHPTTASAVARIATSLPGVLVLVVLSIVSAVLWVVGAISVLATGGLPSAVRSFLEATLRYRLQLLAYHLSLVETYPAFEVGTPTSRHAGALGG